MVLCIVLRLNFFLFHTVFKIRILILVFSIRWNYTWSYLVTYSHFTLTQLLLKAATIWQCMFSDSVRKDLWKQITTNYLTCCSYESKKFGRRLKYLIIFPNHKSFGSYYSNSLILNSVHKRWKLINHIRTLMISRTFSPYSEISLSNINFIKLATRCYLELNICLNDLADRSITTSVDLRSNIFVVMSKFNDIW